MKDKIKFLPLLLLYIFAVSIAFSINYKGGEGFSGDEGRYVTYADNLFHGFYSPRDEVNLWNGPGYPIVLLPLVPFKLLHMPAFPPRLLNALFLFMAILYFYYTLRLYIHERRALFFSYLLGIYPPFFGTIHNILTEHLAIFLVCGFLFHFCKLHHDNRNSWIQLLIASFYLGYLALTKIFFGYVILTGLLVFLSLFLWKKKDTLKKTFLVYFFALLFCVPYLLYTYSLTGRIFYWGNSGGLSLYWMSTPYQGELGDWRGHGESENLQSIEKHRDFFNKLTKLNAIQKDDELKKQAIQNIINHPLKYFKNWMANVGRLLFNYPYSYSPQNLRTYFYIIPNMFLVVFCVLCIYFTYLARGLIPSEIYFLLLFGLISFGGSSLLSSYNRQFLPLVPVFSLWIIFTLMRVVKIEIRQ
jgi:hypothetical protein